MRAPQVRYPQGRRHLLPARRRGQSVRGPVIVQAGPSAVGASVDEVVEEEAQESVVVEVVEEGYCKEQLR